MPATYERWMDLWAHRSRLERYVHHMVGDAHAAEDIVAEVYVAAWRRRDEVPPEAGQAIGWLHGTARNMVRNHVRGEVRRRRLVERATEQAKVRAGEPPSWSMPGVERLVAAEAWCRLSTGDRQLLGLVAHGVSRDRISLILGVEPGVIAMRVLRARTRLRADLDG